MKNLLIIVAALIGVGVLAATAGILKKENQPTLTEKNSTIDMENKNIKEIYFAGGCFWGTEHLFQLVRGVVNTEVGYANGNVKNPTYEQVISQTTGFTEAVKVQYDADEVDLPLLIDVFFKSIDPTTLNRQGNDRGDNYRSGIYFSDDSDASTVLGEVQRLATNYSKPVVVETVPLKNFYKAEDYHQDYLDKNPGGYCHIGPDVFEMARKANRLPAN